MYMQDATVKTFSGGELLYMAYSPWVDNKSKEEEEL